ncbi:MAG: PAS domain-containing sensor histidine kinase [Chloroflexota bacterium]
MSIQHVIESGMVPVVQGVPDPFVVLVAVRDAGGELVDLRVMDANVPACEALGTTRDRLPGSSFLAVNPAEARAGTLADADEVLRSGHPLVLSEVPRWAGGTGGGRFDVHLTPVGDTILLAWRDVTRRVELRDALAESERRYRLIAEHVTDFVIEVDVDGVIRWASPSIERAIGWPIGEVVGRPAKDFIPPGKEHRSDAAIEAVLAGRSADLRVDLVMRDGSIRWFDRSGGPVRDERGALTGIVVAFRDIQAEVEAEQALAEREEHHRLVLENARDVIYLADGASRLAWVSPSITELLGWRPQEIVGMLTLDLIHPDDIPDVMKARAAAGSATATVESRFRRADGGWRWMSALARPVHDAAGTLIGRTGSLRDIEAERAAREALAASEARFRLLAENAADVVIQASLEGILWASPSTTETLGWEPSELVGVATLDLAHPDDRPAIEAGMAAILQGRPAQIDQRFRRPDGSYRWFSAMARPVLEEGRVTGLTVSLRDITALREAREHIEAFNATLEARVLERTHELETFTRALSHDLRSPLRWIDGFAAMLARDQGDRLDEEGRHELAAIRMAAQRMGRLADALLEWVRLGHQPVHPVPVDWSHLADELRIGLRRSGLEADGFQVATPMTPVAADPGLLHVVLHELLANAQQHARPDGPVTVRLAAEPDGQRVRVSVSDDGVGIPPASQAEILEPFVRLREEDVPGVGIGLAIARRAVRMLGSELTIESEPGRGATFAFDLPADPPTGS